MALQTAFALYPIFLAAVAIVWTLAQDPQLDRAPRAHEAG